ncbi:MAG: SMC-Scp complex subunit ScpB [Candidatus Aenigmarchaeota archaeon]|nr:SMC-Scp complex subunit ScpB [Candidatus Aenigmarchaeota archaeon]
MGDERLRSKLEAALYMSNEPLSLKDMSKMFRADEERIKIVIDDMKGEFELPMHGVYILETEQGYQIRVKPEHANSVRRLTPYKDLGKGLLRVLALVAYKQPITQSEIVKVIGNRTYEYVKVLKEKGLISTTKMGRTRGLVPTKEFANYFGLESPDDVKKFFEGVEKTAETLEHDEEELEEVLEEEQNSAQA